MTEDAMNESPLQKAHSDMHTAYSILDAVNRGDDDLGLYMNWPWWRRWLGLRPKPVHDSHEVRMARIWAKKYIDWCAQALAHELAMALGEEVVPVHPAHARDMAKANQSQKAPFRPEGIAAGSGEYGGSPLTRSLDEAEASRQAEQPTDEPPCEHDWAATGHDDIHRCTKCNLTIGYDPHRAELCIPHDWQTRVAGGIECSRCGAILNGVTAGEVERE